ncbi:unnamed protein product [Boreogadus saida]
MNGRAAGTAHRAISRSSAAEPPDQQWCLECGAYVCLPASARGMLWRGRGRRTEEEEEGGVVRGRVSVVVIHPTATAAEEDQSCLG